MSNSEARLESAAQLADVARELDDPPRYECGLPVELRGDPLSLPIYWQGRQWAVTPFGVEARNGTYVIEAERLWQGEDRGHGWVRHMASKNWVDLPDFAEALRLARRRAREP